MGIYFEIVLLVVVLIFSLQALMFTFTSEGMDRQRRCQKLGITFMTIGIMSLIFRTFPMVIFGFIMMMAGFRLMSKGLDSIRKITNIDQH